MGKPQKITAEAAFVQKCNEIDAALDDIRALAARYFGTTPDSVNWGHVGSLERIADLLRQATNSGNLLVMATKRENTPV